MNKLIAVCLATALLGSASMANAQMKGTPAGERTDRTPFRQKLESREIMGDPTKAVEIFGRTHAVARCIAGIGGGKAGSLIGGQLAGDAGYRNIIKATQRRYASCIATDPNLPPELVSGALAEELVLKKGGEFEDRASSVDTTAAEKFYGGTGGTMTMDSIAGCLAIYSPGTVYKLLGTRGGSPEEGAALAAVYANAPECGVSAPPADIAPLYQRASLATALYQWTNRNS